MIVFEIMVFYYSDPDFSDFSFDAGPDDFEIQVLSQKVVSQSQGTVFSERSMEKQDDVAGNDICYCWIIIVLCLIIYNVYGWVLLRKFLST